MSDGITVRQVAGSRDIDAFLRVPFQVHADDPHWVPPLFWEQRRLLDRKRNPFFQHADGSYWVAERDGRVSGRVTAQVNHLVPADQGHFGMICAPDDQEMIEALMSTAEDWLRARGKSSIVGPFNLSINQECGLLVNGFDTPPALLMPHDRPFLGPRLEALGYRKAKDLYAYLCDTGGDLPGKVTARLSRNLSQPIRLRPMNKRAYDDEIRTLTEIFNDAWNDNWGFVPFTEAEVDALAHDLRLLIDPRLVQFVELHDEPIAFGVCLPNLNEAIRDLGGRLLPFGWAKVLWRLKVRRPQLARVPLMGVRRSSANTLAGKIAPFLIIDAIGREGRRQGFSVAELSWVLEDNRRIIQMIETVGGRRYKTYRLFEKQL
jgi:hypothetical protein